MKLKIQPTESGIIIFLPETNVISLRIALGLSRELVGICLIAFAFNHGQKRIYNRPWQMASVFSGLAP